MVEIGNKRIIPELVPDQHYTPHEHREVHKHTLETLFMHHNNRIDHELENLMKKLQKNRDGYHENAADLNEMKKNNPEKFMALADQYGMSPQELIWQVADYEYDTFLAEEQLTAFAEVQVIYAYKQFEINLKRLLEIGFGIVDGRHLTQWENLKTFLKSHNIELTTISGYTEIDQLRRVNNTVKHSDAAREKDIKDIPELVGKTYLDSSGLNLFYERVKMFPMTFLGSLGVAIRDELYLFTDVRLKSISENIINHMDPSSAEKLMVMLKDGYSLEPPEK